uniref:hypothetical protein n=1 Tax=Escherichia coli TaxID=562 RepID=UPI001F365607|nr:hypothetical protein [Escherichia coli]
MPAALCRLHRAEKWKYRSRKLRFKKFAFFMLGIELTKESQSLVKTKQHDKQTSVMQSHQVMGFETIGISHIFKFDGGTVKPSEVALLLIFRGK